MRKLDKSFFSKNVIIIIVLAVLLITQSLLFIFLPNWNNVSNAPTPMVKEEVIPGVVRGVVLTDNGSMSNAGIIIENENGERKRINCNFLSGYYIKLNPGNYKFIFTRGFEFSEVVVDVVVESYRIITLPTVRLTQLFDSYAKGWVMGDLHQHTTYSDGSNNVEDVFLSNVNNGLYYGFLSDHNSGDGLSQWTNGKEFVAFTDKDDNNRVFNPYEANEVTTEFGHFQSLGVGMTFDYYEVVLRDYERGQAKDIKDNIIREKIKYLANEIKRAGGVAQINHPYSLSTMGFNYWELINWFDTVEIWNGYFVPGDGRYEGEHKEQNYKSKMRWYETLNLVKDGGKFLAATGGSDNHEIESMIKVDSTKIYTQINDINDYQNLLELNGKYSGMPATYIHVPDAKNSGLTLEQTLTAIKQGNSFISNGVVLLADINGNSYGETATISSNGKAMLNIEAFCRDGLEKIRIVKNGNVIKEIDVNDSLYNNQIEISGLIQGDWIILEGMGAGVNYAITNPIFINQI